MWRTLCLGVLAFGVAAATAGAHGLAPDDDGTLAVKRGAGALDLDVRGAALGRIGRGELAILIPLTRSCDELKVWGAEDADPEISWSPFEGEHNRCEFSGQAIRFRVIGRVVLEIRKARNVNLTVIGRGRGRLDGAGGPADGTWSLNRGEPRSLPDRMTDFVLEAPRAGGAQQR